MSDGPGVYGGAGTFTGGSFSALLANYIGETVTIFTSSGGQSGAGFTGVILAVNNCFVRLITKIGPPPACSLGNACTGMHAGSDGWVEPSGNAYGCGMAGGYAANMGAPAGPIPGPVMPVNMSGPAAAGGWDGYPVYTLGSVTDIPIASIVSFVHNAV